MPRDLSAAEVAALIKEGTHRVSRSLYLQIRGGNKSWLLRYRFRGKPKWMSLGPAWVLTLTEARRRALAAQKLLLDGFDPLEARRADRSETNVPTFAEAADACIKTIRSGWKRPEVQERQWRNQLATYAFPVIGTVAVDQVDANHLVKILEPAWATKTESMTRLRERIERILDWAKSAGHRSGDNPAQWKGGLAHRLPKPSSVQTIESFAAVPVEDAPRVYASIARKPRVTARLLQFIALTAVRFSEAAKATWSEFDLDADVPTWLIPSDRMKMSKAQRVPLSLPAVALLRGLQRKGAKPGDFVFQGLRGKHPSDTAVRKLLRRVTGDEAVTTHGWRSTMRDWVAENGYDAEAAEAALGHKLGDDVVTRYLRSDLFIRRVKLMDDWAEYLTGAV